ncbi:MAG: glycosyltransferase [Chloroflexi bacterium]|nr:glycosyltransferase [Chloroflexota bacterium]
MSHPPIAIPAYNRPEALARLLASLAAAEYPAANIPLIVAIDAGGARGTAVREVAARFHWPHGPYEIIHHPTNVGLIGNVFFCGRLALQHGAVILLEDDLVVSRAFYDYALQARAAYSADERIAGCSLNALWFHGTTHHPFVPYPDANDVFFMQVAWFQGQLYTAAQWAAFEAWLARGDTAVSPTDGLHELFGRFPPTDWFPIKMKYLVQTERFYTFPRTSFTTNFGDVGTHFAQPTRWFQVPLQHFARPWRMGGLDEAIAVYDSFQELLPSRLQPLTGRWAEYAPELDLYGSKSPANLRRPYVLTTKPCRRPLAQFGLQMWPLEANLEAAVPGHEISLCHRDEVEHGRLALWRQRRTLKQYFRRR